MNNILILDLKYDSEVKSLDLFPHDTLSFIQLHYFPFKIEVWFSYATLMQHIMLCFGQFWKCWDSEKKVLICFSNLEVRMYNVCWYPVGNILGECLGISLTNSNIWELWKNIYAYFLIKIKKKGKLF